MTPITQDVSTLPRGLSSSQRAAQKEVLHRFRAKTSPHISALIKASDAVARQFLPSPQELETFGTESPFEEGKNNRGIYGLERIYEDRAVLTPYFECGAYCRYCFKKTRTLAGEAKRMSEADIMAAAEYIRSDPRIKTVLITGGDPLLDVPLLKTVLDRIQDIPHVRNIRIGTRNILFYPERVTEELAQMIAGYNYVDYENPLRSRNVSVGLSINHADELSPPLVKAAHRLMKRGVTIRGQVTLLKEVNDNAEAMHDLLELFLAVGIVPYYLFHCMPVVGTKHFRTSVQKGIDILRDLSPYSGTTALHYVYVTPLGKHRVAPGHALQYEQTDGQRYLRATTPYKAADFFEFSGNKRLPALHEVDENGYVVSRYLDGDDGRPGAPS